MDNNQKMQEFLKQCVLDGNGYIDFEELIKMPGVTVEEIDTLTGNDRKKIINYGKPSNPYKKKNIKLYRITIDDIGSIEVLIKKDRDFFPDSEHDIYSEIVAAKIAQKLELPFAEYYPIRTINNKGVLERQVLTINCFQDGNKTFYHACDIHTMIRELYSVDYTEQYLLEFLESKKCLPEDTREILFNYRKMILFGLMIKGRDLNSSNWGVYEWKDEQGIKRYTFSCFDNAISFIKRNPSITSNIVMTGVDEDGNQLTSMQAKMKYCLEDIRTKSWLNDVLDKIENPQEFMKEVIEEIEEERGVTVPEEYVSIFTEKFSEAVGQMRKVFADITQEKLNSEGAYLNKNGKENGNNDRPQ